MYRLPIIVVIAILTLNAFADSKNEKKKPNLFRLSPTTESKPKDEVERTTKYSKNFFEFGGVKETALPNDVSWTRSDQYSFNFHLEKLNISGGKLCFKHQRVGLAAAAEVLGAAFKTLGSAFLSLLGSGGYESKQVDSSNDRAKVPEVLLLTNSTNKSFETSSVFESS